MFAVVRDGRLTVGPIEANQVTRFVDRCRNDGATGCAVYDGTRCVTKWRAT